MRCNQGICAISNRLAQFSRLAHAGAKIGDLAPSVLIALGALLASSQVFQSAFIAPGRNQFGYALAQSARDGAISAGKRMEKVSSTLSRPTVTYRVISEVSVCKDTFRTRRRGQ